MFTIISLTQLHTSRPLLFRSTSTRPLHAFSAHVPHPHANVLASDAFSLGLVRSATDFSIYMPTMQGIDLAFYKRRSSYHTPRDALPFVDGGPRALWAMLETAAAAGAALLDADDGDQAAPPVYFDCAFLPALFVLPQPEFDGQYSALRWYCSSWRP